MTNEEQVRRAIGDFIAEVEGRLDDKSPVEKRELLRQIESHVRDALEERTGTAEVTLSDVEAVLTEMDPPESYGHAKDPAESRSTTGKLALMISLGSIMAAGILVLLSSLYGLWMSFAALVFYGGQIAAFVLGISAWPDRFGKAAVFTSVGLVLLSLLLIK